MCLGKILDEYDFETIQGYLIQLTSTSKIASDAGTVTYWVKHLEEIQNAILVATGKIPSEKQKEYEDVVSCRYLVLCLYECHRGHKHKLFKSGFGTRI